MALEKGLAEFRPLFGETIPEWKTPPAADAGAGVVLRPSLFYAHALDSGRIEVLVSDFRSLAFRRVLSLNDLEDLRDEVGIGGSFSEFVDYLVACFSSSDVKLIFDGPSNTNIDSGDIRAKLVGHKSKGLPRISIFLERLVDSLSNDVSANLSLSLFKEFKKRNDDFLKEEEERASKLAGMLSCEKEKNVQLQKQLETCSFSFKRKMPRANTSDEELPLPGSSKLDSYASVDTQKPSDIAPLKDHQPSKVKPRVAPASRRVKVRGVVLQPVEESNEN